MPDVLLSVDRKTQLDEAGFVVLEGFMEPSLRERLRARIERLFEEEGERAGAEFRPEPGCRRLANLVDKDPLFADVIVDPTVLAFVGHVLGPSFKLSSLNARSAEPGGGGAQPLHADMGGVPDAAGPWVCNTVWMLSDFTETNGALRCVPGSHRFGKLPEEVLADSVARHADEVLVTGHAGTVVVMNAHLWHAGTANRTERPRLAMHAFYARSDKPQQQYQRELLREEVQAALTSEQRRMLALDDALNDELARQPHRRSGFLK